MFAGDLPQAIAYCEDGLAVLPPGAHAGQRVYLLISVAMSAGLAGDEERAAACYQQVAALAEAGGDCTRRWSSAYSLWALGLAVWRRGDLDRAAGLEQESLRFRDLVYDPMGSAFSVEALAWIAGSARQYERAAVLLGVADGLRRPTGGTTDGFEPVMACRRDCEQQARQALGEKGFRAADGTVLPLAAGATVTRAGPPGGRQPRTGHHPTRAKTSDRSGVGIGLGSSRCRAHRPHGRERHRRVGELVAGGGRRESRQGRRADLQPLGLYCRSLSGEVVPLVEVGDQAGVAGFPAQLLPGGRV